MSDAGIFEPEEGEVNRLSKLSLLEHISHRLQLSEELEHADNGHLNGEQMLALTEAVLNRMGIDTSEKKEVARHLERLKQRMLDQKYIKLAFIGGARPFHQMRKSELGQIVAATLGFSWEGDTHIGEKNGVVSRAFFEDILDRLEIPGEPDVELTEDKWMQLDRPDIMIRKAGDITERLGAPDKDDWSEEAIEDVSIVVPDYQRANTQWTFQKKQALIDSILKDIPMPTIVLGRTDQSNPWQLVDGQQRLINYQRFMDETDEYNFLFQGLLYSQLEPWAQERISKYRWNVEHIMDPSEDDRTLALLYYRYNSSGKTMTPVQIRLAQFHEMSALHHYLLAMAGGPKLDGRTNSRLRIGVEDNIERLAKRANDIRGLFPRIGMPSPDERKQVRQKTEKTYDLLCRVVGYSLYRKLESRPTTDFPTAKESLQHVLPHYRDGSKATKVADRLDLILRKCQSLFGDYAFVNLKRYGVEEDGDDVTFKPLKSVHGWVLQVQCAALWHRSDDDLRLLESNPDPLKELWVKFAKKHILDVRQNSKTIWEKQDRWENALSHLLVKLGGDELMVEDSERRAQLIVAVDGVLAIPKKYRKEIIAGWDSIYSPSELTFMEKELKERG